MSPATTTPDDPRLGRARLLSCREVAGLLSVSKRTVLRMAARGELPSPVYIAPTLPRWRLADVQRHLDGLAREKPGRPRARPPAARGCNHDDRHREPEPRILPQTPTGKHAAKVPEVVRTGLDEEEPPIGHPGLLPHVYGLFRVRGRALHGPRLPPL